MSLRAAGSGVCREPGFPGRLLLPRPGSARTGLQSRSVSSPDRLTPQSCPASPPGPTGSSDSSPESCHEQRKDAGRSAKGQGGPLTRT